MEDGTEHPVAYLSRSLTPAERRYAQLDKEGLAIVFGVPRFLHSLWMDVAQKTHPQMRRNTKFQFMNDGGIKTTIRTPRQLTKMPKK